jgi:hypothetical protein
MRRYARVFLGIGALLSGLMAGVSAQQARDQVLAPSVGTSSIIGSVVVDEPNGQPLRRVAVTLSSRGMTRQTTTDDKGRFSFLNLPATTYTSVRASKGGFVATAYGQKSVNGLGIPITLTEGQKFNAELKLMRGAIITGTITDNGRPLATAGVTATPIRLVNGVKTSSGTFRTGSATTDDRGVYRIYGLAPGDYVVAVSVRSIGSTAETRLVTDAEIQWAQRQLQGGAPGAATNVGADVTPSKGPAVGYAPVYYPGTTDAAAAEVINVRAGQERPGIDFPVNYVTASRLEGTVVNPDGRPASSATMNLVPVIDANALFITDSFFFLESSLFNRPTVLNGRFSIAGVRPGSYVLAARASSRTDQSGGPAAGRGAGPAPLDLWASAAVTVTGEDQTDIALRLQPGMELTGKVVFEGTRLQPPADLTRMSVRLMSPPQAGVSISVNVPSATVASDGTFKLEGISPGRFLITSFAPSTGGPTGDTWILKSARVGDVDAADSPFEVRPGESISNVEVVFTDKAAELSGTLMDATGKPTTALSIVLFPTDKTQWSQRSRRFRQPVRAGNDGKFRLTNLLPGEYYLAALSDFDPGDVNKPEFLEQVAAAAMKITIAEGEKKVQDLRIAGG